MLNKEKKNRFYFSQKQNDIDNDLWGIPTRFTFVKTPNGWKLYSEWCSIRGSKCNWSDAELVYETDEEPEIIVHDVIPEFINEQQDKISDLEAKLAESEKEKNYYQDLYFTSVKGQEKLKQQLAEKEKELEIFEKNANKLVNSLVDKDEEIDKLQEELEWAKQDLNECAVGLEQKYNQDKISFAVERLKKVRSEFEDRLIGYKWAEQMMIAKICNIINDVLDNQIKQLAHQHEDKGE